jgi:hypothetical protein
VAFVTARAIFGSAFLAIGAIALAAIGSSLLAAIPINGRNCSAASSSDSASKASSPRCSIMASG